MLPLKPFSGFSSHLKTKLTYCGLQGFTFLSDIIIHPSLHSYQKGLSVSWVLKVLSLLRICTYSCLKTDLDLWTILFLSPFFTTASEKNRWEWASSMRIMAYLKENSTTNRRKALFRQENKFSWAEERCWSSVKRSCCS